MFVRRRIALPARNQYAEAVFQVNGLSDVQHALEATGSLCQVIVGGSRSTAPKRDVELDRTGLWRTADGRQGSASLLSVEDTLLPAGPDEAEDKEVVRSATPSLLRGDLTPVLLWGVLVLLIAESWMYHRYLAY